MWSRLSVPLALLIIASALLPRFTSDFGQDYAAAHAWWRGENTNGSTIELLKTHAPDLAQAYGRTASGAAMQTPHPPLATLLAVPFAALPWSVARVLWLLVGWVAILVAWSWGEVNPWTRLATIPLWTFALGLGTHEPLLFLLLALAFRYEDERPGPAGVLLGLAAAVKVYPVFLFLGLAIGQRRVMLLTAVVTLAVACAAAELVVGLGSSWQWLQYVPVNTARYVDDERNLSLVRQVRLFWPGVASFAVSATLGILLTLPLVRHLRRGASSRHLVSAMLLASPLTWRYYVTLLSVQPLRRHEQVALALAALILMLGMLGFIPSRDLSRPVEALLIILCHVPYYAVLLSVWYRAVVTKTRDDLNASP